MENKRQYRKNDISIAFFVSCWIICAFLLFLVISEYLQCRNITFNILTIVLLIIVLILAPFAGKIKFFGIEFTRFYGSNYEKKAK
jgi:cell division protein FtsW (lipid II flippase)